MSRDNEDILRLILKRVVNKEDLSYEDARSAFNALFYSSNDALRAAFITALSMKGESIEELRALLDLMLENALRVEVNTYAIDTCGTGGDKVKTFNVSTAVAFIAAACDAHVAKHGNRAVSSLMGSADILEYLGYNLDASIDKVKECIEGIGIGFLYAPRFHPIMHNIAKVRRDISIRSIFNIVGPLSNPVNIRAQVVGVASQELLKKVAYLLKDLRDEVMVFYALDGMDELSNTCINKVIHVKDSVIKEYDLDPKDLGLDYADPKDIIIKSKEEAARVFLQVINGYADKHLEDIAVLNAAAALIVGKRADGFKDGIDAARGALRGGKAYKILRDLIAYNGSIERLRELEELYLSKDVI